MSGSSYAGKSIPSITCLHITSLLFLLYSFTLTAQGSRRIDEYFTRAAVTYNVPKDILVAIAGSQTHFSAQAGILTRADEHLQPPVYGLMALRDDEWFGHSLRTAAELIGQPVEILRGSDFFNILGAAAYLSSLADKLKIDRGIIAAWKPVLEAYSGIPQADLKEYFSYEVLILCSEGIAQADISIKPHTELDMRIFREDVRGAAKVENTKSTDYSPAVWDSTPNCTIGSITQSFAVVHTTEGSFSGSLSWLKNPTAQASAHYIIRSRDGYMVQLVRESNKAWHARCWNSYMLGVEHEAYVAQASYYTDAMYIASAGLFRHFAQKFNIPINRNRIIGHYEWQNTSWKTWMTANYPAIDVTCNSHTDPGVYWDWDFYLQLVAQDTTSPAVISASPASGDTVPRNAVIQIKFNQKMKAAETQSAFSISPSVAGTLSWTDNQRTLVFTPSAYLTPGTVYTVSVSKAAVNYLSIVPIGVYSFSFTVLPQLALNSVYPSSGTKDVPLLPPLTLAFNSLVKPSTLNANITLVDSTGSTVVLSAFAHTAAANKSTVIFTPSTELMQNARYVLRVNSGLLDTAGFAYSTNSTYTFVTIDNYYFKGAIFDSLESIGGWKSPLWSGSTINTDSSSTFTIVTEKAKTGAYAGKLKYLFTKASGGICREYNSNKPSQGSLRQSRVGFWVYGDLSNNFLEYWFYYNSSSNATLRVDTLDWRGWKYVEVPLSRLSQTGDKLFHSLVIVQNPAGSRGGTLYFDDGQRVTSSRFDVSCSVEGLLDLSTGRWRPDTLTVSLRSKTPPYTLIESQKAALDSSGLSQAYFSQAVIGDTCYLVINHRSGLEVWTKVSRKLTVPIQSFDFLKTAANAYDENLIQLGGRYCLYSGDVNQDGVIDFSDVAAIDNAMNSGQTGYTAADINGDGVVNYLDLKIASANVIRYIKAARPK